MSFLTFTSAPQWFVACLAAPHPAGSRPHIVPTPLQDGFVLRSASIGVPARVPNLSMGDARPRRAMVVSSSDFGALPKGRRPRTSAVPLSSSRSAAYRLDPSTDARARSQPIGAGASRKGVAGVSAEVRHARVMTSLRRLSLSDTGQRAVSVTLEAAARASRENGVPVAGDLGAVPPPPRTASPLPPLSGTPPRRKSSGTKRKAKKQEPSPVQTKSIDPAAEARTAELARRKAARRLAERKASEGGNEAAAAEQPSPSRVIRKVDAETAMRKAQERIRNRLASRRKEASDGPEEETRRGEGIDGEEEARKAALRLAEHRRQQALAAANVEEDERVVRRRERERERAEEEAKEDLRRRLVYAQNHVLAIVSSARLEAFIAAHGAANDNASLVS